MELADLDLGGFTRPTTSTASAAAQAWFDRGLAWCYAFNHEAAVRCFETAIEHDDAFALAHWGVAFAVGPNYNKAWEDFAPEELRAALRLAHDASARAAALADGSAPAERDLIRALRERYREPEPPEDLAAWSAAYADAMVAVAHAHPEDLDVAALAVDALMLLTPWALWDVATGEVAAGARTTEALELLEAALARPGGDRHPYLLHLHIHLLEMSPRPEAALPSADTLRELMPGAGHLLHMGTHIDVLCGDYQRTIADNRRAVAADERYLALAGPTDFYVLYHAHDLHFIVYGALFAGQEAIAREAAAALVAMTPASLLRIESPPMADLLEGFTGMHLHVLIRFGRWAELIATPLPEDPELFATTTALTHYARGVAHAATGDVGAAEREREAFHAAFERVPETRYLFTNTCRDILTVAGAMLDGELEYRRGDHDAGFAHLRRAIDLADHLPYDEPWGWMQPTRHAYGALLLECDRVEEAAAVYAADLGLDGTLGRPLHHPDNVWSLHGYHECLTRLGRDAEAALVAPRLRLAQARADVEIRSSCFCRGAAQAA